eukprot:TRINITY_DN28039_c0_g1_i2.p2 TRINITY_DN28039_c0_g1~~TRINITY_DN28039_c0_g1_i2.p2  ORF type:complete len:467 (-),score=37.95 TRINITY_DN28039_c0_g1_i2:487-1782(-)
MMQSCGVCHRVYFVSGYKQSVPWRSSKRWKCQPSFLQCRRKTQTQTGGSRKLVVTNLVNVDVFSPSVVLGGVMVGAGCYLYVVRQQNPKVSKDFDVIAATMMTVTGGILFLQGWRLDPLLLLSELLLATMVFYFANDALTLRQNLYDQRMDDFDVDPRSINRRMQQQYQRQQQNINYQNGTQLPEGRSDGSFSGWMGQQSQDPYQKGSTQFYQDQYQQQQYAEADEYDAQPQAPPNPFPLPRNFYQREEQSYSGGIFSPLYRGESQQNLSSSPYQQQPDNQSQYLENNEQFQQDSMYDEFDSQYAQGGGDYQEQLNYDQQFQQDQQRQDQVQLSGQDQNDYQFSGENQITSSGNDQLFQDQRIVRPAEFTDISQSNIRDENSNQYLSQQNQNANVDQGFQDSDQKQSKKTSRWQISRDLDLEIEGRRKNLQ